MSKAVAIHGNCLASAIVILSSPMNSAGGLERQNSFGDEAEHIFNIALGLNAGRKGLANPCRDPLQHFSEDVLLAGELIIEATTHRFRPILLTAAAAILGMFPIAPTIFWGPMAYAIMGGLAVATLLTLVFLPALYVTWFRISAPTE